MASGHSFLHHHDIGAKLRTFINGRYAPLIVRPGCQLAGLAVMLTLVALSAVAFTTVRKGMPDKYFVNDDSYVTDVFADLDALSPVGRSHEMAAVEGGGLYLPLELLVEGLDAESKPQLQLLEQHVAGFTERSDIAAVQCLPLAYRAYLTAAGLWRGDASANATSWEAWVGSHPKRLAAFGHAARGSATGALSGRPVPAQVLCLVYALQPQSDAKARSTQAAALNSVVATANAAFGAAGSSTRLTLAHLSFATHAAGYEPIDGMCLGTAGWALLAVSCVLCLTLPTHRAILATLNVALVVLCLLGFMGAAGITYNPISYSTLTMAIGFCVDYTVEVMHFSTVGPPGETMRRRMVRTLATCGYDVLHGCATAFIGVLLLSFASSQAFRWFGFMCMVMCAVAGVFALWSLPSILTLVADLCCGGKALGEGEAFRRRKGSAPAGGRHRPTRRVHEPEVLKYVGAWACGEREGHGVLAYHDGGCYNGHWARGAKEGVGAYTYPSGAVYEGQWAADVKEGAGEYRFADGKVEVGAYRGGLPVGTSAMWSADRMRAVRMRDGAVDAEVSMEEAVRIAADVGLPPPKGARRGARLQPYLEVRR